MWYCFLRICKENRAEINRNKLKEGKRRMECWKWKTKEKKEIMEWRDKEKETSTSWNNVTYLKRNINHNWIRLTKIIKNNHREISNKKKEGIKSKTKLYNYFKYVFLSYSVLSWIIFLCFFFLRKKQNVRPSSAFDRDESRSKSEDGRTFWFFLVKRNSQTN